MIHSELGCCRRLPRVAEPQHDPRLTDVLSTSEVRELLGYATDAMVTHLWRTGQLPGERKGKSLVFHRATVEEHRTANTLKRRNRT